MFRSTVVVYRFFLKLLWSKMDQFDHGVEVFVEATQDALCPVKAIVDYAEIGAGPFCFCDGMSLMKASFVGRIWQALIQMGLPSSYYYGHSFRRHSSRKRRYPGFHNPCNGMVGKFGASSLDMHSPGCLSRGTHEH